MYGKYENDMRIRTLLLRFKKNRYPSEILQKLVEFSEKKQFELRKNSNHAQISRSNDSVWCL